MVGQLKPSDVAFPESDLKLMPYNTEQFDWNVLLQPNLACFFTQWVEDLRSLFVKN
ncbi:hypothetical protein KR51_00028500 [Rubidibacter lacunae KORDI 51-2]|uniref:Uncharacterized protein n=1 Tax=Rubidibacter lacunae KORDI 51-2 TaxID=582515 RepID=U5D7L2_9CHRO|nr:hypothetical protein [Rubidibacter lacunae]ERN40593.1 hypothetical protein KR51_00028500 [Rubidibacter lacunae KORDI 51-2]